MKQDSQNHRHASGDKQGNVSEGALLFSVLLNLLITLAQIIGGILSRSLSLISDALHNLSDGLALLISLFAHRISRKEHTLRKTFGYKRAEIIAALFNATVLVIISFFLFKEAIERFFHPAQIDGGIMLTVASFGLLANLVSVFLLHRSSRESLNIRTAYLHLLSDTISSVAVIIGGILIQFFGIFWIDPILTIGIGLYVLKESFSILGETVSILMQSAPAHIDIIEIKREVEAISGVGDIHHVHVWNLNDKEVYLEAHVTLEEDTPPRDMDEIRRKVEAVLTGSYHIYHTTIQFEFTCCSDSALVNPRDPEQQKRQEGPP